MYTQCPECLTYFQVTPEHLKIAQGNVRCGQCRNVFSALGNLTEQPPASAYQTSPGSLGNNNDIEDIIEEEVANKPRSTATSKKSTTALKQGVRAKTLNNLNKNPTTTNTQPKPKVKAKATATKSTTPATTAKPVAAKTKAKTTQKDFKQKTNPKAATKDATKTKTESKSRLGHAIDAIKALNKSGTKKLNTLEDGRDSYIDKIKDNLKKEVKKRAEPQNKKPAAKKVTSKKAAKPNNKAPRAAPPVKPNTTNHQPPASPKREIISKQQEIDLDKVFQDIDDLDIGNEKVVTGLKSPSVEIEKSADIKIKNLPRNQADKNVTKQNQLATAGLSQGKSLTVIPKQLVDDFRGVVAEQQPVPHNPLNTLWNIGSIVLMLVFLVQTIYFKHNDLAKSPQLRPWIESFCKHLACDLTLPSDIKKLELLGQDIRSHPKQKKALLVSTTIINNAGYNQSYPILEITFSNMNGQKIAMRRFLAAEYLPIDTEIDKGMPPNTPIKVELGMLDPGADAVNFEFDFLPST